jgi:hypothetical protein
VNRLVHKDDRIPFGQQRDSIPRFAGSRTQVKLINGALQWKKNP